MKIKNNKKITKVIIVTMIVITALFITFFLPLSKSDRSPSPSTNISNFSDIEDNIPDPCANKISNKFRWIESSIMTFAKRVELDERIELIYINCNSKVFNLKDKTKSVNINVPLFGLKLKNPSFDHDRISEFKLQFKVGMDNIIKSDLDATKATETRIDDIESPTRTLDTSPLEQLISESSEDQHELTDNSIINKNAEGKISLENFQVFSNYKVFALENQHLFLYRMQYFHFNIVNTIIVKSFKYQRVPFNIFTNEQSPKLNDFDLNITPSINRFLLKGKIKLENNKNFKDIQEAFGLTDTDVGEKIKINLDFVAYNSVQKKLYNFLSGNDTDGGKNFRLSYNFNQFFDNTRNTNTELVIKEEQRDLTATINNLPEGVLKKWLKNKIIDGFDNDIKWQARATIVLEFSQEEKYNLVTLIPNQIFAWDIFKKDVVKKSTIKLDHKNIDDTKINISIYSRFANSNNKNQRLLIEATTKSDKKIKIDKTFSGVNSKIEWDLTKDISTMVANSSFNKVSDIKELSINYGISDKSVAHDVINNTPIKVESVPAGQQLPLAPPIIPNPPTPPTPPAQKKNWVLIIALSVGIPLSVMFLMLAGVTAWTINIEIKYRKTKEVDYSEK